MTLTLGLRIFRPRTSARRARWISACVLALAAVFSSPPARAEGLSSPNHVLFPFADTAGGDHLGASTNYKLGAALGQALGGPDSASANVALMAALVHILSRPGTVTTLTSLDEGTTESIVRLQWSAPGYDGGRGDLQTGTSYFIRVASFTVPDVFLYTDSGVLLVSTSGTKPGATVSATASGLQSNTTYFAHIWTRDPTGNIGYTSFRSTFVTLAKPPTALPTTFVDVFETSAAVQWAALPGASVQGDSNTSSGYILETSSTDFGAFLPGGLVISSQTPNVALSTLTVGGVDLNTTFYFRVASLNWLGKRNPASLLRLNLQISTSTTLVDLGGLEAALYASTVSVTPLVVSNIGTVPVQLYLSASTATAGTPWSIGVSSGEDTVALQGLWNASAPDPDAFVTALTTASRLSGGPGGDYAGGQDGNNLLAGANRSLWFRFWRPTTTITTDPQLLDVKVKAVYKFNP